MEENQVIQEKYLMKDEKDFIELYVRLWDNPRRKQEIQHSMNITDQVYYTKKKKLYATIESRVNKIYVEEPEYEDTNKSDEKARIELLTHEGLIKEVLNVYADMETSAEKAKFLPTLLKLQDERASEMTKTLDYVAQLSDDQLMKFTIDALRKIMPRKKAGDLAYEIAMAIIEDPNKKTALGKKHGG